MASIHQPASNSRETCANCGITIGAIETAHIFAGRVVCRTCHDRLNEPAKTPSSIVKTSWLNKTIAACAVLLTLAGASFVGVFLYDRHRSELAAAVATEFNKKWDAFWDQRHGEERTEQMKDEKLVDSVSPAYPSHSTLKLACQQNIELRRIKDDILTRYQHEGLLPEAATSRLAAQPQPEVVAALEKHKAQKDSLETEIQQQLIIKQGEIDRMRIENQIP